jgi:phosphonate degradation associated HDIG domain protein
MKPEEVVSQIKDLYKKHGHEHYGEGLSQLQHMMQTAELALRSGADEEVILAAFLHDIGHLLSVADKGTNGDEQHEKQGAQYLRDLGFSERVASLVEGHVAAKRYLTAAQPGYHDQLSDASKQTLEAQGGPMSEKEAFFFEQNPWFELCINLRRWDDQAKNPDKVIKGKKKYWKLMLHHLEHSEAY